MRSDPTTRLGLAVGGLCALTVVVGVAVVAAASVGTPRACPAVAWGTTVVVETRGAVDRVALVEVVADEEAPAPGAGSPEPRAATGSATAGRAAPAADEAPRASPVEQAVGPRVYPGAAEAGPDGVWTIASWGATEEPDGAFPERVTVRAWGDAPPDAPPVDDLSRSPVDGLVVIATRSTELRFERVGGDRWCGGPGEARIGLEVPPAA